jgi:geranylgeranyl pyrophosphate synthase
VLCAFQDKDSSREVERLLRKRELNSKQIEELLDVVLESKSVAKLRTRMVNLVAQAQKALSMVSKEPIKKQLANMAKASLEDL